MPFRWLDKLIPGRGEDNQRGRDEWTLFTDVRITPVRVPERPAGADYPLVEITDWSRDGSLVAYRDYEGAVCVLDAHEWRIIHRVGRGRDARFLNDDTMLAFLDELPNEAYLVDMARGWTLRGLGFDHAYALASSSDGSRLAIREGGQIRVLGVRDDRLDNLYVVEHEGSLHQLAVTPDRLVVVDRWVDMDRFAIQERCTFWDATDPAAPPQRFDLGRIGLPLDRPPDRNEPKPTRVTTRLLADCELILHAGVREHSGKERVEMDVIDVGRQTVLRTIPLPGRGSCRCINATPDGSRVVMEVGLLNGRQRRLLQLEDVAGGASEPSPVARVEWSSPPRWLARTGHCEILSLAGDSWRFDFGPAPPRRSRPPPPGPAFVVSPPHADHPAIGEFSSIEAPLETQSRALLVAGRAVETGLATWAQISSVRETCRRHGGDVEVFVAGDETEYDDVPRDPEESYLRVVIGYFVVAAHADHGPRGPISIDDLRTALRRAEQLGPPFWDEIRAILSSRSHQSSAAETRALHAHFHSHRVDYEDVALDPAELLTISDRVHLLPTGPLAHAELVVGVPGIPPEELDPTEAQWWHHAHATEERVAVRGKIVVRPRLDTFALDVDALSRLVGKGEEAYLIANFG